MKSYVYGMIGLLIAFGGIYTNETGQPKPVTVVTYLLAATLFIIQAFVLINRQRNKGIEI
ncbi:hypothetical protein LS684_20405 [Cytobacillus spongiae]|jgi:hypothetical protein|uniref:hypothetical protein n=1 Tax=Cytobacillus spongiae TaxID=2901381 RepID=UPI001F235C52|nr:hypothetical protein [Cytobacillus spongiae]UII55945.1 hypothetical protein LS684_20405 [Cytobacillus spongiae]